MANNNITLFYNEWFKIPMNIVTFKDLMGENKHKNKIIREEDINPVRKYTCKS